jgi:TonB-dependent receptor
MKYAPRLLASIAIVFTVFGNVALAQSGGSLVGTVRGAGGDAQPGATIRIAGSRLGAVVDSSGHYQISGIPAGQHAVRVTKLGFAPDSATIDINDVTVTRFDARLLPAAEILGGVVVNAQRLGETRAAALERRAIAPNVVTVLSGDDIRALPTLNAAEAAGRISGVTTERDEGEGKFIQIRGTEPRLSNVTVNGAHLPGTETGNRIPKLDDVPSDVLAAIEVSKTLTAEMDADAIGGSVNLVTKTPEGAPHGYVSGQMGQMTLEAQRQYQGGFAYGGRVGEEGKLGFLLGGSADRNNRSINDLEPAWTVDGNGRSIPVEWSQRDYVYGRNRYGVAGDVDYRVDENTSVSLKGLWSLFENFGTRYNYDITTGVTGSAFGSNGDSAGVGPRGFGTGAQLTREISQRTPREQLYGGTLGAHTLLGSVAAVASLNYAGTRQSVIDYRFSPFVYDGPGGQGITLAYDASSRQYPRYTFADAATAAAAANPANYGLTSYSTSGGLTTGRDAGGSLDFSLPYQVGAQGSTLRFGAKARDEQKDYVNNRQAFVSGTALMLPQVIGTFSDPAYYTHLSSGFTVGAMPNLGATNGFENAHPFQDVTNAAGNALSSFNGSEKVYSAYVSNSVDAGPFQLYLGLRAENTHSAYTGHVVSRDTTRAVLSITTVPGSKTYTDLFPSAQVKYELAPATQLRLAVTRGIARPNYSDLAPHLQGTVGGNKSNPSNLSSGNPDLRPQHAWNYDVMLEHFFPSVGVISAGAFYKSITDLIVSQDFVYEGPVTEFVGQAGTRPTNVGSGHLLGFEAEWSQRLTSLPGLFNGLGFDANWTHVESRALIDPTAGRYAPLPRQAPNLGNFGLTYDRGPVSSRAAWSYQGANIVSYGDGTPTANGDNYFYAHSQIDASVSYNFTGAIQLQLQALNLNNAVFGFFNGTPSHDYSVQREYYGRTFYLGAKYGL